MNAVSEIDATQARPADENPDIILGEDWVEQARENVADPPPQANRRFAMGGSSLARKIITFNLLALVVLVGGILYLNAFREGLIAQKESALRTEAALVARLIAPRLTADGDGLDAAALAGDDLGAGNELHVYGPEGALIASTRVDRDAGPGLPRPPQGTMITDFLNTIWEQVAALFGPAGPAGGTGVAELAKRAAAAGLGGHEESVIASDANGDPLLAVSTPLMRDGTVAAVLVLTAVSPEIGEVLRNEREQVLQMFVVAILVSVGLSLMLASTIANPLRDLALAAEYGKSGTGGKPSGNRVRIPDMTGRPDEIGRLSGAFRDMVSALYDRIDSNERFAADVAHEIKNPLSSLRSAVESLRIGKTDEQRERLLAVIEHDVRRLDRLVSDISNASRLDSELIKEEPRPFDLVAMINNLVTYHELEAREIGAEFIADLPDRQIVIMGLEERLAQVFVNLLTNAISFCSEGDAVKLWVRQRQDRVLVVVEDTGPGIPEDALEKVFTRFYSDRPQNDYGNHSGLGLAISRQIVLAHGGVIWAENIRPTDADITSEPLGARFVVGLQV